MKKIEKFDYLLFTGKDQNSLHPACAYKHKEDAIDAAKRLEAEKIAKLKCIEVVYMPEDDIDANEVVWSNYERK
jgi:hypothetical protein